MINEKEDSLFEKKFLKLLISTMTKIFRVSHNTYMVGKNFSNMVFFLENTCSFFTRGLLDDLYFNKPFT